VLFGDWSRVFVRLVNGIRFEQSRDFAWNTDQTVFRAVLRADGALIDTTGAIKWLANSAT
jgi:HK97 family phage major capsid protein